MNAFAIINIAKKQLGMVEDDYRALLIQATGKTSLRDMSEAEHRQVIEALKSKGFKTKAPEKKPASKKKYVRLIYVLWRKAHEAGAIDNGSRQALRKFVENKSGVSDPEFLDYDTATPIIEALKGMDKRKKQQKQKETQAKS